MSSDQSLANWRLHGEWHCGSQVTTCFCGCQSFRRFINTFFKQVAATWGSTCRIVRIPTVPWFLSILPLPVMVNSRGKHSGKIQRQSYAANTREQIKHLNESKPLIPKSKAQYVHCLSTLSRPVQSPRFKMNNCNILQLARATKRKQCEVWGQNSLGRGEHDPSAM